MGRSPEGGNGNPLQYFCPENPINRGVWWATVHGFAESDTTEATKQTHTYKSDICVAFPARFSPTALTFKNFRDITTMCSQQGTLVGFLDRAGIQGAIPAIEFTGPQPQPEV